MNIIAENLQDIQLQINTICAEVGRTPDNVSLLAVSKQQSITKIRDAFAAGQRLFGENYVQEALNKMKQLSDLIIEWHFIGRIQTNKTRAIAEHFAFVHTVDRELIANRLNEQRPAHLPPLQVCIQVNLANEAQKAGITLQDLPILVRAFDKFPRLKLRGLMAIPPANLDGYAQQYAFFQRMHECLLQLQQEGVALDTLSMGMSQDFKAAIAAGATIIRIGSGIFGGR